jgi:hypothetical protein
VSLVATGFGTLPRCSVEVGIDAGAGVV